MSKVNEEALAIAEAAGYQLWQTGGGCQAFGKMLKEVPVGDDVATLDILITTEGGTDVDGSPNSKVWECGITYTDPNGGDTLKSTRGKTLAEVLTFARGLESKRDEHWTQNYRAPGPRL